MEGPRKRIRAVDSGCRGANRPGRLMGHLGVKIRKLIKSTKRIHPCPYLFWSAPSHLLPHYFRPWCSSSFWAPKGGVPCWGPWCASWVGAHLGPFPFYTPVPKKKVGFYIRETSFLGRVGLNPFSCGTPPYCFDINFHLFSSNLSCPTFLAFLDCFGASAPGGLGATSSGTRNVFSGAAPFGQLYGPELDFI